MSAPPSPRTASLEDLLDGAHDLLDGVGLGGGRGEPQAHLGALPGDDLHLAHFGDEARVGDPEAVGALLELAAGFPLGPRRQGGHHRVPEGQDLDGRVRHRFARAGVRDDGHHLAGHQRHGLGLVDVRVEPDADGNEAGRDPDDGLEAGEGQVGADGLDQPPDHTGRDLGGGRPALALDRPKSAARRN